MTEKRHTGTNTSFSSYRGIWLIESLDTIKWLKSGTQEPTPVFRLIEMSVLQRYLLVCSPGYCRVYLRIRYLFFLGGGGGIKRGGGWVGGWVGWFKNHCSVAHLVLFFNNLDSSFFFLKKFVSYQGLLTQLI